MPALGRVISLIGQASGMDRGTYHHAHTKVYPSPNLCHEVGRKENWWVQNDPPVPFSYLPGMTTARALWPRGAEGESSGTGND